MSPGGLLKGPAWLMPMKGADNRVGKFMNGNELANRAWDQIFSNLSTKHKEFPAMEDGDTLLSIRRKLRCLLPEGEAGTYLPNQLRIWAAFLDQPMCVPDEDLAEILTLERCQYPPLLRHVRDKHSQVFYITSWTITLEELKRLVQHLQKEEKTFRELKRWLVVAKTNGLQARDTLTIRYIGSCELLEWPLGPLTKPYDEFAKPYSGVFAEFLSAVKVAFPAVAATARMHLLRDIVASPHEDNELILQVLLEFFRSKTLVNRWPVENFRENHEEDCAVGELGTSFHENMIKHGAVCPDKYTGALRAHFKNVMNYVNANPAETGTISKQLAFTPGLCTTLLDQSVPILFQGKKAMMVLAGKGMHLNDYINARSFFRGANKDSHAMSKLVDYVARLEGMATPRPGFFSYYCLAPWPKHDDDLEQATSQYQLLTNRARAQIFLGEYLGIVQPLILVTFGKTMASLIVRDSDSDNRSSAATLTTSDFLSLVGRPAARSWDTSHFIHIPLPSPNAARYHETHTTTSLAIFMEIAFVVAVMTADIAMDVLSTSSSNHDVDGEDTDDADDDLHSKRVRNMLLRRIVEELRHEVWRTMRDPFDTALECVRQLVLADPLLIP
ncbi:Uu.00g113730.m01.CDS01 [Anthostomella pinea]|uniref:Uu.00g113730.m01.CDS01 n=1 Tax=Anthostomella pinea TaxID=933095 RepID=A0AAI8VFH0_9PEZI|nr:Uu.00g113730.m01.CDS01 [Anthostomella pinea]